MPDVVAFIESNCNPELLKKGKKDAKGKGKKNEKPKASTTRPQSIPVRVPVSVSSKQEVVSETSSAQIKVLLTKE